ncbi:MAG: hypothetical protein OXE73_06225 [Gammaproteobacteria bacterium]|nr:hypothetical protein [Gammaproteobacteria bacterium]
MAGIECPGRGDDNLPGLLLADSTDGEGDPGAACPGGRISLYRLSLGDRRSSI